jgi:hypothetical protein
LAFNLLGFAGGDAQKTALAGFPERRVISVIMALSFPSLLDFAGLADLESFNHAFFVLELVFLRHEFLAD